MRPRTRPLGYLSKFQGGYLDKYLAIALSDRSPTLYPTELRAQSFIFAGQGSKFSFDFQDSDDHF
jgi:hypothetical protein